jgi:hypothetical protein
MNSNQVSSWTRLGVISIQKVGTSCMFSARAMRHSPTLLRSQDHGRLRARAYPSNRIGQAARSRVVSDS